MIRIRLPASAPSPVSLAIVAGAVGDPTTGAVAPGTARWKLDAITRSGLDEANGLDLHDLERVGNPANQIALAGASGCHRLGPAPSRAAAGRSTNAG